MNYGNLPRGGPRRSWGRLGAACWSSVGSTSPFEASWAPLGIVLGPLALLWGLFWGFIEPFWSLSAWMHGREREKERKREREGERERESIASVSISHAHAPVIEPDSRFAGRHYSGRFQTAYHLIGRPTCSVWVPFALESIIDRHVAVALLFVAACCFARVPVAHADR